MYSTPCMMLHAGMMGEERSSRLMLQDGSAHLFSGRGLALLPGHSNCGLLLKFLQAQ